MNNGIQKNIKGKGKEIVEYDSAGCREVLDDGKVKIGVRVDAKVSANYQSFAVSLWRDIIVDIDKADSEQYILFQNLKSGIKAMEPDIIDGAKEMINLSKKAEDKNGY